MSAWPWAAPTALQSRQVLQGACVFWADALLGYWCPAGQYWCPAGKYWCPAGKHWCRVGGTLSAPCQRQIPKSSLTWGPTGTRPAWHKGSLTQGQHGTRPAWHKASLTQGLTGTRPAWHKASLTQGLTGTRPDWHKGRGQEGLCSRWPYGAGAGSRMGRKSSTRQEVARASSPSAEWDMLHLCGPLGGCLPWALPPPPSLAASCRDARAEAIQGGLPRSHGRQLRPLIALPTPLLGHLLPCSPCGLIHLAEPHMAVTASGLLYGPWIQHLSFGSPQSGRLNRVHGTRPMGPPPQQGARHAPNGPAAHTRVLCLQATCPAHVLWEGARHMPYDRLARSGEVGVVGEGALGGQPQICGGARWAAPNLWGRSVSSPKFVGALGGQPQICGGALWSTACVGALGGQHVGNWGGKCVGWKCEGAVRG